MSTQQPFTPATISEALHLPSFSYWGSLAAMVRSYPTLCEKAGYKPADLRKIPLDPSADLVSIGSGIAAIGRMMATSDASQELAQHEIQSIGCLLATLGDTAAPLIDLQVWLDGGEQ
ncbi:hypothetical protein CKO42_15515 [Lamprobacter modestohalophilus]|uniref:Uncharacterized protein n=2 Tax=Lamprobacter modestohalophilus TaxID=1064514 RepID=A0A9X0WA52_9GAMM|nr:hypothetical protein [Lamprobacter modestohalophilus]